MLASMTRLQGSCNFLRKKASLLLALLAVRTAGRVRLTWKDSLAVSILSHECQEGGAQAPNGALQNVAAWRQWKLKKSATVEEVRVKRNAFFFCGG